MAGDPVLPTSVFMEEQFVPSFSDIDSLQEYKRELIEKHQKMSQQKHDLCCRLERLQYDQAHKIKHVSGKKPRSTSVKDLLLQANQSPESDEM